MKKLQLDEFWKKKLAEEITDPRFSTKKFLKENQEIISGDTEIAKYNRLIRCVKRLREENSISHKPQKINVTENNNIFDGAKIKYNLGTSKTITFGIISDTHFNSKYSQLTYLNRFYDICAEHGVKDIYHCGDIDDGEGMRVGHSYENYTQGASEHLAELVRNYPYREGIVTHFITGNHDASFYKSCGLDFGQLLASKRSDLNYLGKDLATIAITDKINMMLRHPWDGHSYALSYKPQKMIEALSNTIAKPNILVIGHYHKMEYLYYLGIHCLQAGCFQGATPFTIGKGIRISLGGWIVTVEVDNEGNLKSFIPKAVTFDRDILNDYQNYTR